MDINSLESYFRCHPLFAALLEELIGEGPLERAPGPPPFFSPAEKCLLHALFQHKENVRFIYDHLQGEDYRDLKSWGIFASVRKAFLAGRDWNPIDLEELISPDTMEALEQTLREKYSGNLVVDIPDALRALRKLALRSSLERLQGMIARRERAGNKDELSTLLFRKQEIVKKILAM